MTFHHEGSCTSGNMPTWGKKHMQSGDSTSFNQTPRFEEVVRKTKENGQILTFKTFNPNFDPVWASSLSILHHLTDFIWTRLFSVERIWKIGASPARKIGLWCKRCTQFEKSCMYAGWAECPQYAFMSMSLQLTAVLLEHICGLLIIVWFSV